MLLILSFGLMVGFSLGLTGGGGSVFAVPLLVYGLHLPVHQAVVISLAVVGFTAFGGGLARWRDGQAQYRIALIFGLSGLLGAPLGAWLNPKCPEAMLLGGFASLMLLVALRMWRQAQRRPKETHLIRAETGFNPKDAAAGPTCHYDATGRLQLTSRCALCLALAGSVTGLLSGLFGVGGGFYDRACSSVYGLLIDATGGRHLTVGDRPHQRHRLTITPAGRSSATRWDYHWLYRRRPGRHDAWH